MSFGKVKEESVGIPNGWPSLPPKLDETLVGWDVKRSMFFAHCLRGEEGSEGPEGVSKGMGAQRSWDQKKETRYSRDQDAEHSRL